jgi:hypothetical protein
VIDKSLISKTSSDLLSLSQIDEFNEIQANDLYHRVSKKIKGIFQIPIQITLFQ